MQTLCKDCHLVSTHSRPKAAGLNNFIRRHTQRFNTQPPEGGWTGRCGLEHGVFKVSTHSRPKAAGHCRLAHTLFPIVSTHSRPKAAGNVTCRYSHASGGFNTQPPEGGWQYYSTDGFREKWFQHTAARRRLDVYWCATEDIAPFQHTAARRRLGWSSTYPYLMPSFNTQPPEGGWRLLRSILFGNCCFNTQPPEGGWLFPITFLLLSRLFQHTAARRRLAPVGGSPELHGIVSTHSRPKAAGVSTTLQGLVTWVSTHSRPKAAGWRD